MPLDTLGRAIRRPPAGTPSESNRFGAERPLDSGSVQIFHVSDLNHLATESSYRTLATIPGFTSIERVSPTGVTIPAIPRDFDWLPANATNNISDPTHPPACACLGFHRIDIDPASPNGLPTAVLRGRVEAPSAPSDSLGAILVVTRSYEETPLSLLPSPTGMPAPYVATHIPGNGGFWEDLEISLPLLPEYLETRAWTSTLGNGGSGGISTVGEEIYGTFGTFWCAFYSTSGKCQAVALVLDLEPA